MNEKRIRNHLTKHFIEWVNSITDPVVKDVAMNNTFITGGAIASLLNNEQPNDYDIYCKDKATTKLIAQYYVDEFNRRNESTGGTINKIGYHTQAFVLDGATREDDIRSSPEGWDWNSAMLQLNEDQIKIIIRSDGVKAASGDEDSLNTMDDKDIIDVIDEADEIPESELENATSKKDRVSYRVLYLSPNAITLSDKIQIVIRFYGEPAEIHSNYDFIHCTNYWTYSEYKDPRSLVINKDAMVSLHNKQLKYVGSKYPLSTLIRLRKFYKREWTISAGQIVKIAYQLSEFDLTDPVVLEDQLVGIDTAYFLQLISSLQSDMESEDFEFSNDYFFSLIDKIFGE